MGSFASAPIFHVFKNPLSFCKKGLCGPKDEGL